MATMKEKLSKMFKSKEEYSVSCIFCNRKLATHVLKEDTDEFFKSLNERIEELKDSHTQKLIDNGTICHVCLCYLHR